jgi:hypothetical protein
MSTTRGGLAVGDFVFTSWGYDQTNVSFYRVEGLTPSGKSVRIVQVWAQDVSTGDNPHRSLVPTEHVAEQQVYDRDDDGHITGTSTRPLPAQTVLILDDRGTVKVDGHHAWKWDGKPKYATGHGYGH